MSIIIPFAPRIVEPPREADDAAAIAARFAPACAKATADRPPPRGQVSAYLDKPLRSEADARAQSTHRSLGEGGLHPLFAQLLRPFAPRGMP